MTHTEVDGLPVYFEDPDGPLIAPTGQAPMTSIHATPTPP